MPLLDIGDQSLSGAIYVCDVHRVGADAGKLRPWIDRGIASFRVGDDFPNGAAAQTAGAKFQRFVEPVVQLAQFTSSDKLVNYPDVKVGRCASEQGVNVFRGRVE